MAWLRLTDAQSKDAVFVNMDLIVMVRRFPSQDITRLTSVSPDGHGSTKVFTVTEAPDEIMDLLESAPTSGKSLSKTIGPASGRA